ncbi:metal-dependent hydrolase [Hanstruepera neustonica]|uniref:Metal-dependent hydrolase n=1 Tax=Hanstruepera neustonica TaxID=1445657 RepID=A0A2K1DVU5_9FLAO|nr:amidohydrolase family protein [Hanstruepera neustonica]PNQ72168.1 metal-dependent hydrolase [Hanstruepera neustonica]
MKLYNIIGLILLVVSCNSKPGQEEPLQNNQDYTGPIIDMHMHAENDNTLPPDKLGLCIPLSNLVPHFDPKEAYADVWTNTLKNPNCKNPIWSSTTFEDYSSRVQKQLTKFNVIPVVSGSESVLRQWAIKFGDKIIPSIEFNLERDNLSADSLKSIINKQNIKVFGEISNQYAGIAPNDPRMDDYYAMAEALDIPVAIHLGTGAPGSPYMFSPDYVAAYSNPLLLEEVLKKYPRLRISVMHYGEPFIDEMITMMYHYPQIYVDLGGIQWAYPSEYFYEFHLKKMIAAGFGKRIMFGSDTFIWPELLEESITIINNAEFLTKEQKADIFYNNAARFLRLDK